MPDSTPTDPNLAPPLRPRDSTPGGKPRARADSVPLGQRLKQSRPSLPGLAPEDAARCRIEGRWEQLIEILLVCLDRATVPLERAKLFVEIAEVFRDGLADPAQALDALLEAWREEAAHDATLAPLEELARSEGRWPEVVRQTEEMLGAEKSPERAFVLCERLFWWFAFDVPHAERAAYYAERIRSSDATQAVVHLYQALVYGARGDIKGELHELDRAALSARRPEDRARLHLLMAGRYEDPRAANPSEAKRRLRAALQADPRCVDAMRALASIFEREDDAVSLAEVLDRHAEATRDAAPRVALLRRLADLHEKRFLKPDVAAEKLRLAFSLDPNDLEVLSALERCYRATRAWPELAAALEVASLSNDPAVRTASLASLAEVLDDRLHDAAGAYRAYERVSLERPTDEEVLGHLERLAEKIGDWRAAADWRTRHAELATSAAVRARMHVAAGQLLAAPDREPRLAIMHFEEAVACDPTLEGAWTALLWDARQAGDAPRLARYLAERAAAAEGPRQKAQLYVELAELRLGEVGDEPGAIEAYVAANHADPTNEAAARALVEIYVASQRWQEAAPVCARVALAAERDGDTELLAFALRMGRRIATGDKDGARALAMAALRFELRADSEEARGELVESAFAMREDPVALERARPAIDGVADFAGELSPQALAELATVLAALGEEARAQAHFEAALRAEPRSVLALAGLSRVFAARGDFVAAGAMEQRLAGAQETVEARYEKLLDAAETYAVRASNWPRAIEAFEQASALRPADPKLLHTLVTGYQKLGRWEDVSRTLRRIAESSPDRAHRSKTLFTMAQIARDKLSDADASLALFEQALDLDPRHLEAFERVVRLLTERRDWRALEQAYIRMIGRAQRTGDERLQHALYHQIGLIYRDRLGDHAQAIEAFRAATFLAPSDPVDQAILRELLALGGRVADAVEVAAADARRDPLAAAAYAPLFELLLGAGAIDRAWSVSSIMHFLGAGVAEAERLFFAYELVSLANIQGSIGDGAWTQLLHPELDPTLTEVFEVLAPAVAEVKLAQIGWRDRLAYPGPTLPTSGPHAWIGESIAKASWVLGLDAPKVFVRGGPGAAAAVAATRPPSLVVSPAALEATPPAMHGFILGKHVAALSPPLVLRALCPSVSELGALASAAARIVAEARPGPMAAADEALRGRLKKAELERLRDAVGQARGRTIESVERWAELAALSTSRAGLLLVGDLELARGALAHEGRLPSDLSIREQMEHLVTFAVSDTYAALRQTMGVALAPRR